MGSMWLGGLALGIGILAVGAASAAGAEVLVDDFEGLDAWQYHDDGGVRPEASLDTEVFTTGASAMRVRYAEAAPHWGNLTRAIELPADTVALRLDLYVRAVTPQAAMHLWLFEPDSDAWLHQITDDGKTVGAMSPGWHHITLPVGAFSFQPRGAKTRGMAGATKLLLGCNYGDLDVTVDNLRILTRGDAVGAAAPTTEGLAYPRGAKGAIAILAEGFPPLPGSSDPAKVRALLEQADWGVTLLRGGDLSAEGVLTREHLDALVLPYGPMYPAAAGEAIKAYLKSGGGLITMGGYAFDRPMAYTGAGWEPADASLTAAELDAGKAIAALNTRLGQAGDAMNFAPEQIQLFDPAFTLKRVAAIRWRDHSATGHARADVPVEGYSAVSTAGSHSPVFPTIWARRIPLVEAVDSHSRARGTVGALVHNFAGPYAGSSWAAFGVTSHDLFTGPEAPLAEWLPKVTEAVVRPSYIARLKADYACYRRGETMVVSGELALASAPEGARVRISAPGLVATFEEATIGQPSPEAPHLVPFEARLRLPENAGDYYGVTATLAGGEVLDEAETGVVVWDEATLARGPKPSVDASYLAVNGKHTVLQGTNETGFVWFSEHEDPAVWDADFRAMADHGVNVLRLLHFSPFSEGGYEGKQTNRPGGLANRPEKLARATDALVQLAQKHGIILFLSLHDWMDVGLSDADLEAQREWDTFWTARYRDVPGVIYDIQNEPSIGDPAGVTDLVASYNAGLAARYGDEEALKAAWGVRDLPAPWGSIAPARGDGSWSDVRSADYERWRMDVFRRWTMANRDASLAGDPDALVTVGFLPFNSAADIQTGAAGLDFTNFHFYGSLGGLTTMLPFLDRRWEGLPLSIGEFGAQEAHDNRTAGLDGTRDAESIRRFLWFGHHLLGRGGSFLANWSWKDFEGSVFPWGIRYLEDPVSKDVLLAYRAQSALFRLLEPVYEDPSLFVVLPDSHRFGPAYGALDGALQACFAALYQVGEPFGVIGESDLARLPAGAHALVWPMPYCPADAAFERVRGFVEDGGALYLSGDVAFDEFRKPTRADRLAQLGLPDGESHVSPEQAPAEAADAEPILGAAGTGKVFFVPFPVESRASGRLVPLYRSFLSTAGIAPAAPAESPAHVLRVPSAGGGHIDVLACGEGEQTVEGSGYSLDLRAWECGLLALDGAGELRAFHAPRTLTAPDGGRLVSGDVEWIVGSLDGEPLGAARAALLAPLDPGESVLDVLADGQTTARLVVGEVVDGTWVGLSSRDLVRQADGWHITVGEDDALSLMLLVTGGDAQPAAEAFEGLMRLTREGD